MQKKVLYDYDVLTLFEDKINSTYKAMSDAYGGYNYSVTNTSSKVTATTAIDYTELNLKQLVQDDSSMKFIVNDKNEITLEGIKFLYIQMEAQCDQ